MNSKLTILLLTAVLFLIPKINFGQAPNLGTTVDFVLFSADGAVTNSGITQLTGHVGTNNGSSTGFGNVNGTMHDNDGASAQAAVDLLIAYGQLNSAIPNYFPAPLMGNGQTLVPGVYSIPAAATINGTLSFDAQNDESAVFIIQIGGSLSTGANTTVDLVNGAQACNIFWKVEGLVDMASGTTMRGTVVANNAAININSGGTLEGRALSTTGAISVDGILGYTPIGCGSPLLQGPQRPALGKARCFGILSADGPVTNSGITNVNGDVGTNVGLTTGFDPLLITGTLRPIPDGATAEAAADLLEAYDYLNTLPHDIELLYPAQFGNDLVLTPHTYLLDAATTFNGALYLNAQGNSDAVFVIKINGALSTSTYAEVILMNGTQTENVYWMVNGAVDLNDYTVFNGSVINQGAFNLYTGVTLKGRALVGVGAITTNAIHGEAEMIPSNCETVSVQSPHASNEQVTIFPNPFSGYTTIQINDATLLTHAEVIIYNVLGMEVMRTNINGQVTTLDTIRLAAGVYSYKVTNNNSTIQSGMMVSHQ